MANAQISGFEEEFEIRFETYFIYNMNKPQAVTKETYNISRKTFKVEKYLILFINYTPQQTLRALDYSSIVLIPAVLI